MKQKYSEAFIEQAAVKLLSRGKRTVREVALERNVNYASHSKFLTGSVDSPPRPLENQGGRGIGLP